MAWFKRSCQVSVLGTFGSSGQSWLFLVGDLHISPKSGAQDTERKRSENTADLFKNREVSDPRRMKGVGVV